MYTKYKNLDNFEVGYLFYLLWVENFSISSKNASLLIVITKPMPTSSYIYPIKKIPNLFLLYLSLLSLFLYNDKDDHNHYHQILHYCIFLFSFFYFYFLFLEIVFNGLKIIFHHF